MFLFTVATRSSLMSSEGHLGSSSLFSSSDADPGAAVVRHRLQSRLQEHLEPKSTSANDCLSIPALPRPLRRTWIRVGT